MAVAGLCPEVIGSSLAVADLCQEVIGPSVVVVRHLCPEVVGSSAVVVGRLCLEAVVPYLAASRPSPVMVGPSPVVVDLCLEVGLSPEAVGPSPATEKAGSASDGRAYRQAKDARLLATTPPPEHSFGEIVGQLGANECAVRTWSVTNCLLFGLSCVQTSRLNCRARCVLGAWNSTLSLRR